MWDRVEQATPGRDRRTDHNHPAAYRSYVIMHTAVDRVPSRPGEASTGPVPRPQSRQLEMFFTVGRHLWHGQGELVLPEVRKDAYLQDGEPQQSVTTGNRRPVEALDSI